MIEILAATYAAEVVPNALRPFVLSSINMCWLVGQVIGTGILRSLVHETSQWSYRLPFALQWAWAIPLLFGVWFAPDSPCKKGTPVSTINLSDNNQGGLSVMNEQKMRKELLHVFATKILPTSKTLSH